MNAQELLDTDRTLVTGDNCPRALDASNSTCNKRLSRLRIPLTDETRHHARLKLATTIV